MTLSFRLGLLAAVEAARGIAGPTGLDVRTNQLTIRTRTWSGAMLDDGTATDSDLVLPAHYPVRNVALDEVASSGGVYETGDVLVNHITPSNGVDVGYTREQLNPKSLDNNVEILYLLTGSHSGEYALVECRTFRSFSYSLVLRRRRSTP